MICKKCGKEVEDSARFCRHCGVGFKSKAVIEGETVVLELDRITRVKNVDAIIALTASLLALAISFLPLSQYGIKAVVGVMAFSVVALLFHRRGKKSLAAIYKTQGYFSGKGILSISLTISIIMLASALFTITKFI